MNFIKYSLFLSSILYEYDITLHVWCIFVIYSAHSIYFHSELLTSIIWFLILTQSQMTLRNSIDKFVLNVLRTNSSIFKDLKCVIFKSFCWFPSNLWIAEKEQLFWAFFMIIMKQCTYVNSFLDLEWGFSSYPKNLKDAFFPSLRFDGKLSYF